MERIQFEKSRLISEIQETVISWFNQKPEVRNVAFLSRETGVTDSSIRRLLNNNVKIADDSILKLLTFVSSESGYESFLAVFADKKEIVNWFIRNYSYLKTSPALQEYVSSPVEEDIVLNSISFFVFALVASLPVTKVSLIQEQFGVRGNIEMENLVKKGILGIVDGNVVIRDGKKIRIDKDQAINLLPEITRTYLKKDSIHNYRALEIEAVSQDGFGDLMDLFAKFLSDVHTIYKAKPGNIPVVVAGFVDTFTTQPYFEGGKIETPN